MDFLITIFGEKRSDLAAEVCHIGRAYQYIKYDI